MIAHGRPGWIALALRCIVALASLLGASLVIAQPAWESTSEGLAPIPALSARVTDVTQTLTAAERQALESKLADWEQRTGNQLVVLIVPTTRGEPIEGYSLRVAEAWKIGRKGQDNGALFVVAKDDRK
ncbi:MAG: TPM domain-containing protein, partial [Betaproteobacteria bacterium]